MTKRRRITLEIDTDMLFDQLRAMNGDTAPLGQRLVETLLAPPGFGTALGMSLYGVEVVPEHGFDDQNRSSLNPA